LRKKPLEGGGFPPHQLENRYTRDQTTETQSRFPAWSRQARLRPDCRPLQNVFQFPHIPGQSCAASFAMAPWSIRFIGSSRPILRRKWSTSKVRSWHARSRTECGSGTQPAGSRGRRGTPALAWSAAGWCWRYIQTRGCSVSLSDSLISLFRPHYLHSHTYA